MYFNQTEYPQYPHGIMCVETGQTFQDFTELSAYYEHNINYNDMKDAIDNPDITFLGAHWYTW